MKTVSQVHAEAPFSQLLMLWATDRISRALMAIKPSHSATQIAAHIAVSGNPSGA